MSSEKAFDLAAKNYDSEFTNSAIGVLQRNRVHDYLRKNILEKSGLHILELNCGTGSDAEFFLKNGHSVVATDISQEMLTVTRERCRGKEYEHNLETERIDLNEFDKYETDQKFDLVFSNFAGLNCIDQNSLKSVMQHVSRLLKKGGRFVSVFLARKCLWEQFYFLLKRKPEEAVRRMSNEAVMANVSGELVATYYFSPQEVLASIDSNFEKMGLQGIGIAVPPSYLEPAFVQRSAALNFLDKIEALVHPFEILANRADHFLIDLKVSS